MHNRHICNSECSAMTVNQLGCPEEVIIGQIRIKNCEHFANIYNLMQGLGDVSGVSIVSITRKNDVYKW